MKKSESSLLGGGGAFSSEFLGMYVLKSLIILKDFSVFFVFPFFIKITFAAFVIYEDVKV